VAKTASFIVHIAHRSGQSTTNARQHLLRKHDITLEAAIRTAKVTISHTTDLDSHVLKKVLNKDAINSTLVAVNGIGTGLRGICSQNCAEAPCGLNTRRW